MNTFPFNISPVLVAIFAFLVYVWHKQEEDKRNQIEDGRPSLLFSATQNAKNFFGQIKGSLKRPLIKSYDEIILASSNVKLIIGAPNAKFVPQRNKSFPHSGQNNSLISNLNRNQSLKSEIKNPFKTSLSFIEPKTSVQKITNNSHDFDKKTKNHAKPSALDLRNSFLDAEDTRPKKKQKTEEFQFISEEPINKLHSVKNIGHKNPLLQTNVSPIKNGHEMLNSSENILDFYRNKGKNNLDSSDEEAEFLEFDKDKFFSKDTKEKIKPLIPKSITINDQPNSYQFEELDKKPDTFITEDARKKKVSLNSLKEKNIKKDIKPSFNFGNKEDKDAPIIIEQEENSKRNLDFGNKESDKIENKKELFQEPKEYAKPNPKPSITENDPLKKYAKPQHSSVFGNLQSNENEGNKEKIENEATFKLDIKSAPSNSNGSILPNLIQNFKKEESTGFNSNIGKVSQPSLFGGLNILPPVKVQDQEIITESEEEKEEQKRNQNEPKDFKFEIKQNFPSSYQTPVKEDNPIQNSLFSNNQVTPSLPTQQVQENKAEPPISIFGNLSIPAPSGGTGLFGFNQPQNLNKFNGSNGIFGVNLEKIDEKPKENSNPFGSGGIFGSLNAKAEENKQIETENPEKTLPGLFGNLNEDLNKKLESKSQNPSEPKTGLFGNFMQSTKAPTDSMFNTSDSKLGGIFGNLNQNTGSSLFGNLQGITPTIPENKIQTEAKPIFGSSSGGTGLFGNLSQSGNENKTGIFGNIMNSNSS